MITKKSPHLLLLMFFFATLSLLSSLLAASFVEAQAITSPPDSNNNNNIIINNNETTDNTSSSSGNTTRRRLLPPFNYTGYFVDANAQFSSALHGMCIWTRSDSLCIGTVIPIVITGAFLIIALVYNCCITPQKSALMNAAALRDSPLWPASLQSLTDDEIAEIVSSSAGLALKDLFPLLGLESLVTRAAALGLATLKDLLLANALAVRDIGIEVREQRIMARSLERIAQHAKKVVAEKRKNKKDRRQTMTSRGRGASGIGRSVFGAAFGGGDGVMMGGQQDSDASRQQYESPLLFSPTENEHHHKPAGSSSTTPYGQNNQQHNINNKFSMSQSAGVAALEAAELEASVAVARTAASPAGDLRSTATTANFNQNQVPSASPAASSGGGDNNSPANASGSSGGGGGNERWRRLRARFTAMAALGQLERLATGEREGRDNTVEMMDI